MNKRVLITGAASGLGWELSKQYQALGWHVILLDRDAEKLSECSAQLSGSQQTYDADLTDEAQITAALAEIVEQPLDLLINNAGITHRSMASETDIEVFRQLMAVNWLAPIYLTKLCLPALQRRGGGVICISSMAAKMPLPGRAGYCASKSAMSQHFETWRPELLSRGIDLLMVYPSFLNTSIEANALGHDGNKTLRPRSTVGAIHSPDQMARLIIRSQAKGKQRLLSRQASSRFAAWLWVRAPWLFQRLMWNRFAEEWVT